MDESDPLRVGELVREAVVVAEGVAGIVIDWVDDEAWLGEAEVVREAVAACEGVAVGVRPVETDWVGETVPVGLGVCETLGEVTWLGDCESVGEDESEGDGAWVRDCVDDGVLASLGVPV